MKLLSDAAEYALRAVVWLARQDGQAQTTEQIAASTGATPGYLARVLQSLGRAGIVHAKRGVGGGFTLERDPRRLTALEVISAVDPLERIHECPLRLAEHAGSLCALHARIDQALAWLEQSFGAMTIEEITRAPSGAPSLCPIKVSVR